METRFSGLLDREIEREAAILAGVHDAPRSKHAWKQMENKNTSLRITIYPEKAIGLKPALDSGFSGEDQLSEFWQFFQAIFKEVAAWEYSCRPAVIAPDDSITTGSVLEDEPEA
jgi:hypothetical protein